MPKVKYLKDLCSGAAGTVHDLQDYEANVLIKIGAAEHFNESEAYEAARLAAEEAEAARLAADENNLSGLLLNLNGTPVIDDFGGLVELLDAADIAVKKKTRKPKRG